MLENTKLYQELQKRESKYLDGIKKVYKQASDILPKINRIFEKYTGHGVEHSIHVMEYPESVNLMSNVATRSA